MHFVSSEIEKYCTDHSTSPSHYCQELEQFTLEKVPMSVMLSGPLEGSFLGLLVGLTRAKRVLEVGCYTGYSALAMAEWLPQDGELITLDINPETDEIARQFWNKSPHGRKIKSIVGPASESIAKLKGPFDLVFVDADKTGYLNYFKQTLPLLSDTGVFVADNALRSGHVVDPNTDDEGAIVIRQLTEYVNQQPNLQSTLLPIRDGLFLVRKLSGNK